MASYIVTTEELQYIANAIRTKGGTSSSMVFPDGFVTRINNMVISSFSVVPVMAQIADSELQVLHTYSGTSKSKTQTGMSKNNVYMLTLRRENAMTGTINFYLCLVYYNSGWNYKVTSSFDNYVNVSVTGGSSTGRLTYTITKNQNLDLTANLYTICRITN